MSSINENVDDFISNDFTPFSENENYTSYNFIYQLSLSEYRGFTENIIALKLYIGKPELDKLTNSIIKQSFVYNWGGQYYNFVDGVRENGFYTIHIPVPDIKICNSFDGNVFVDVYQANQLVSNQVIFTYDINMKASADLQDVGGKNVKYIKIIK